MSAHRHITARRVDAAAPKPRGWRWPTLVVTSLMVACGSTAPPPPTDHPVWQIGGVDSAAAAWAVAARADQPLLIVGNAAYGLSPACVPQRYYSERDTGRQLGAQADTRLLGSGMDERRLGAAADERRLGAAADDRRLGAAADARRTGAAEDRRLHGAGDDRRQTGSASDQRFGGAAQDERLFGGDARGRHFGAESVRRDFGAVESRLRCRLAGATLVITGAGTTQGYLYSPRLRGAVDGVVLR